VLKDESGQVIAGINSSLYCWHAMSTGILYVEAAYRHMGYGKLSAWSS
jgi:hypothetical protein